MDEKASACALDSIERVIRQGYALHIDQGPSATIPSRITKLMIQAMGMSSSRFEGKTVVDFGCGGGHLSFAALEFGASKVIGIDRDPLCAETFQRNLVKSRFEENQAEIILAEGLHELPEQFRKNVDIVVSNPAQIVLPHDQSLPTYGYDGPDGRDMLDHFLNNFENLLTINGMAFLSNSCFANPAKTIASLTNRGFNVTIANEEMIDLYEQMYAPELLNYLKLLPYLDQKHFVADSMCQYKFRAFCLRIE